MRRLRTAAWLLSLAACDSASVYEDCADESKAGSGDARCPPSTYEKPHELALEVFGRVTYGDERIPNAVVRMEPSAGFTPIPGVEPTTTTTDDGGVYRVRSAPFRYDLFARTERDVTVYRGMAYRFLEVTFERDASPRAWTSRVEVAFDGGPRPGQKLGYFLSGEREKLAGATLAPDGALVVATRAFDVSAVVHVLEYPPEEGPLAAVAHGKVEVNLRADAVTRARVVLAPVDRRGDVSFAATPPSGFVADDAEVFVDFGLRSTEMRAARVPLGRTVSIPLVDGVRWAVSVRATRDGAVVASGRRAITSERVEVPLFAAPAAVAPAPDTVADARVVVARAEGVVEHVLVPEDRSSPTLHVVTTSADAIVPDFTALGISRAAGRYTWTVRDFPELSFVDALSGIDARLDRATGWSAPRPIVLP